MSQENVEMVRKFFDAYNAGDLEATLHFLAPTFEFRPSGVFLDTEKTYRGREGFSEFWHTFREAWESITVKVERVEDLGQQMLILAAFQGRGKGSGVDVTRESAWITTLDGGLFAQSRTFGSWTEALEAVGLSE